MRRSLLPLRVGDRTRERVLDSFNNARQRPFSQWLKALGVPPAARNNLEGDWQTLAAKDTQAWLASDGIGPGRAAQLSAFFATRRCKPWLKHYARPG